MKKLHSDYLKMNTNDLRMSNNIFIGFSLCPYE